MNKQLVAISGWAASGKTTLANILSSKFGYEILSFAQPLKEIAESMIERKLDKSQDRMLLINLGSYLKGQKSDLTSEEKSKLHDKVEDLKTNDAYFKESVFVNLLAQKIKPDKRYVVDDLRFLTEYRALKEIGFVVVQLECLKHICEKRLVERDGGFDPNMWKTKSEMEFTKFNPDMTVFSGSTKEDLLIDFCRKFDTVY